MKNTPQSPNSGKLYQKLESCYSILLHYILFKSTTGPQIVRFSTRSKPIGSMGLVYISLLIYHKHQPNVVKYTSPMDGMGKYEQSLNFTTSNICPRFEGLKTSFITLVSGGNKWPPCPGASSIRFESPMMQLLGDEVTWDTVKERYVFGKKLVNFWQDMFGLLSWFSFPFLGQIGTCFHSFKH